MLVELRENVQRETIETSQKTQGNKLFDIRKYIPKALIAFRRQCFAAVLCKFHKKLCNFGFTLCLKIVAMIT